LLLKEVYPQVLKIIVVHIQEIKLFIPDFFIQEFADRAGIKHVHFISADGLHASVPIDRVLRRQSEVLLAYEMNGDPLPAAHGFPLRVLVPGHVGVRNVKWVNSIVLSAEEAIGPWQRGMAYKYLSIIYNSVSISILLIVSMHFLNLRGFGPSLKSLDGVDVESIPSLQEQPVQSVFFSPERLLAGEVNTLKGYAYSGGGKGIVRVDVSLDGGQTWRAAQLTEGAKQPLDRAYAWTFFETDVDLSDAKAGRTLNVVCKATDSSYNVQPDTIQGIWNLRGINNNAWHRLELPIVESEYDD
jgi:sulfite oxidase